MNGAGVNGAGVKGNDVSKSNAKDAITAIENLNGALDRFARHALDCLNESDETPLDRQIREAREAFAAWELALRNCRDGEATPEDVKRYAIAVSDLINEARDLMPYSENT